MRHRRTVDWRVAVSSDTEGPYRVESTTPADQSAQFRLTAIRDEPVPPAQLQEPFTATTFVARTTAPVAPSTRQALLPSPSRWSTSLPAWWPRS